MNYVYFILNASARAIKIGFSADPAKRVNSLKTFSPDRLELFACVPGQRSHELALHHALVARRRNGEWFEWDLITHELIERAQLGAQIEELISFASGKLFTRREEWGRLRELYRTGRLAKQIEEALA